LSSLRSSAAASTIAVAASPSIAEGGRARMRVHGSGAVCEGISDDVPLHAERIPHVRGLTRITGAGRAFDVLPAMWI
jgi:hypothetical protein